MKFNPTHRTFAITRRRAQRFVHTVLPWLILSLGVVTNLNCINIDLGGDPSVNSATAGTSPVTLVRSENVDTPAMGSATAFKPTTLRSLAALPEEEANMPLFFMTFATRSPQALQLQSTLKPTLSSSSLVEIAVPAGAGLVDVPDDESFRQSAQTNLDAGRGIFWVADDHTITSNRHRRVGMMIPPSWLAFGFTIEAFVTKDLNGQPMDAARISIVRDFFYLAVIGDSVLWGNGLREQDKMSALTAKTIERELGVKVIQQRYAHAGARIVPAKGDGICLLNCFGEAPTSSTSVTLQAELIERPDLVQLVLMDGCINDVGVDTIIDANVSREELEQETARFCGEEMTTLLSKVRTLVPEANVVVTGYYPMVGAESDLSKVEQWLGSEDVPADIEADFVEILTARAKLFHDVTKSNLQEAVDLTNATFGGSARVAFVDANFSPDNAAFTELPWLWSLTDDDPLFGDLIRDLAVFPEDPMFRRRLDLCLEQGFETDLVGCIFSSVGHPNERGAQAYAEAIIEQLRTLAVLPR